MATRKELKPCPFCGGKAKMIEHDFHKLEATWGVRCVECGAQTNQFFTMRALATKAWNRRTQDD